MLLRHRAYATHPYILSTADHVMLSFFLTSQLHQTAESGLAGTRTFEVFALLASRIT